jgi:hypothetical protein
VGAVVPGSREEFVLWRFVVVQPVLLSLAHLVHGIDRPDTTVELAASPVSNPQGLLTRSSWHRSPLSAEFLLSPCTSRAVLGRFHEDQPTPAPAGARGRHPVGVGRASWFVSEPVRRVALSMRRHDRLAHLAACHGLLRTRGIRSLAEYRSATPEQLADLGVFLGAIRELVAAGNPDVMLALWPPSGLHWSVARISLRPTDRLLTVSRGTAGGPEAASLSLTYDCTAADAERRAWVSVRDALRGA